MLSVEPAPVLHATIGNNVRSCTTSVHNSVIRFFIFINSAIKTKCHLRQISSDVFVAELPSTKASYL